MQSWQLAVGQNGEGVQRREEVIKRSGKLDFHKGPHSMPSSKSKSKSINFHPPPNVLI